MIFAACALAACGDDANGDVNCDETPSDPSCQTGGDVDCDETPSDPSCQAGGDVDCDETPNDPSCQAGGDVDCDETPDDPSCLPGEEAFCEAHPDDASCDDGETACTIDEADLLDVIDPQTTLYDIDSANLNVTNGQGGEKTLIFALGGRPDSSAEPTARLYLDLEAGAFLPIDDNQARENSAWDIAFDASGFAFTNSGQSGPKGRRQIMQFPQANFDDVVTPGREDGIWLNDLFFDKETCEANEINWGLLGTYSLEPAMGTWYDYDFNTHTTPVRDMVYVIYNGYGHNVYKVQFTDYNASTGEVSLEFAYTTVTTPTADCLEAPNDVSCQFFCAEYDQVEAGDDVSKCPIDCSDLDDKIADGRNPQTALADTAIADLQTEDQTDGTRLYTFKVGGGAEPQETSRLYLDLQQQTFVEISDVDAPNNAAWDIGFDNLGFAYTNSGQNHDGWQGARQNAKYVGVPFEDVDTPDGGWFNDTYVYTPLCEYYETEYMGFTYNIEPAIGAWLDDDGQPKDEVYAIYSGSPAHNVYKVQFESYDASTHEVTLRFQYLSVHQPVVDCATVANDLSCATYCVDNADSPECAEYL